jgi:undecaprenyl phosphate-alpha-L-ara4N flippase subunit ArnE
MTEFLAIIVILIACIIGAFGAVLLKKGSKKFKINFKLIKNKHLIMGMVLYAFSTLLFIPALKHGELSVIYPFVATVYIWVTLFSKRFLKEEINFYKWLGISLIILGVIFIGLGA